MEEKYTVKVPFGGTTQDKTDKPEKLKKPAKSKKKASKKKKVKTADESVGISNNGM